MDLDEDMTSKTYIQVLTCPVTHSQSKQFNNSLNGLIKKVWAQDNLWRPIEGDEGVSHGRNLSFKFEFVKETSMMQQHKRHK